MLGCDALLTTVRGQMGLIDQRGGQFWVPRTVISICLR